MSSLRVWTGDSVCNRDASGGMEISGALPSCPEGIADDVLGPRDVPDEFWLNVREVASGTLEDGFTLGPQRPKWVQLS